MKRTLLSSLCIWSLVSCTTNRAPVETPMSQPPPDPTTDDPHAPRYGPVKTVEVRLVIDPIEGGKRLQAVSLHFDNDDQWIVSYRADPRYFQFADKRVVVTGRTYSLPSDVQQVMSQHFAIDTIELAPGESTYETPPTEVPAPPFIESSQQLSERLHLWGSVVGALVQLHEGNEWWRDAVVQLGDGHEVNIIGLPAAQIPEDLKPGDQVTVLGRVMQREDPNAIAVVTAAPMGDLGSEPPPPPPQKEEPPIEIGARAICRGRVARCGMRKE